MLNSLKTTIGIALAIVSIFVFHYLNGRYAPPDKLVLTVSYLGDRDVKKGKKEGKIEKKTFSFLGKEVNAETKVGARAPRDFAGTRKSFFFPLGITSLAFTDSIIPESPTKEGFILPVKGKRVTVDVVFNLSIMGDDPNIVTKLLLLLNKYQTVTTYSGDDGKILQALAKGIFREELRQAFTRQTQGEDLQWVANNKKSINSDALIDLNAKFNRYGIRFDLAAISSDVDLDENEQRKMNRLVYLAANNEVQKKRNELLLPQKVQLVEIQQEGETAAAVLENTATVKASQIKAEAEARQHKLLSSLLEVEDAVKLKSLLTLYGNGLKSPITVIPPGTQMFLGNNRINALGGVK